MNGIVKSAIAHSCILLDDAAVVKALQPRFRAYQKQLSRLRATCDRGDMRRAAHLSRQILGSYHAKLTAIVRTTKMPKAAEPPFTLDALMAKASGLHVDRAAYERVRLSMQDKLGGGTRSICKFGWKRRAYQQIVADILDVSLPIFDFDYMHKGRGGVDEMVRRIKERLEREPFEYVVTADIKNCFGSVRKENVPSLLPLLPDWVVSKILLIDEEVPVELVPERSERGGRHAVSSTPKTISLSPDAAARQGMPAGASTSGLIMRRAVLGPLLAATPFAERVFLLGDDIAVLAGDRAEADAIDQALRSLFESTVVGPLAIGRSGTQHRDGWINLPKYALKRRTLGYSDGFSAKPSLRSYQKWEQRFGEKVIEDGYDAANEYLERWPSAFPLWETNETSLLYLRGTALAYAPYPRADDSEG